MITLYFRSIDDLDGWTEEFETAEEAVSHFLYQMGNPMILVHHMLLIHTAMSLVLLMEQLGRS